MMLVSLAKAKLHLRVDHDDDDSDIELKLMAASGAVVNYLKSGATFLDSSGEVETDSSGDPVGVPYQVQAATLLLLGDFYKNRESITEDAVDGQFGYGYLPKYVTALLYPLRDPALK
jgi:hypothetical protein